MKRMLLTLLGLSLLTGGGCLVGGCKNMDAETVMSALERGKAVGKIKVVTDGRLGVGQDLAFWIGGQKTVVDFSGSIDYSGPAKREADDVVNP